MTYTFKVEDAGDQLFTLEDAGAADDPDVLIELCADQYWREHDGWESSWPLHFELFADGVSLGKFAVDAEFEPHFWSHRKLLDNPSRLDTIGRGGIDERFQGR